MSSILRLGDDRPMPDKILTPEQIALNCECLRYVGDWLRYRRHNQAWLAEEMEVTASTISKWLKGKQPMTLAQFTAMARLLNCKPHELLFKPGDQQKSEKFKELSDIISKMGDNALNHFIGLGRELVGDNPDDPDGDIS